MNHKIDVYVAPFPDQLRLATVINVNGKESERDIFGTVCDVLRHIEGNYLGDVHIRTCCKTAAEFEIIGNVEDYGYAISEVGPARNPACDLAMSDGDVDKRGYYEGYNSRMHKPGGYGWGRK